MALVCCLALGAAVSLYEDSFFPLSLGLLLEGGSPGSVTGKQWTTTLLKPVCVECLRTHLQGVFPLSFAGNLTGLLALKYDC